MEADVRAINYYGYCAETMRRVEDEYELFSLVILKLNCDHFMQQMQYADDIDV